MKIKQISIILIAFFSMTCVGASNGFAKKDKEPSISKTFTLNEPGNLIVETSGGGVTVSGHDKNTVIINVFVRKNGELLPPKSEFLSKLSEGYELSIKQNATEFIAIVKRINKMQLWKRTSISFKIMVPLDMSSSLKTSGGSIKVYGITGCVNGKTSGGSVKVKDNRGNMNIATRGGSIAVTNSIGNIKAHTSGGSIKLENITGNTEVSTSGGSITLNGKMPNVIARTSGGSIKANITGVIENLNLKTSGGGICTNIPANLGMDLNLKGNHVNVQLKNFDGTTKKNHVIGTMNGGGIPVYMHTSSGGVKLNFSNTALID